VDETTLTLGDAATPARAATGAAGSTTLAYFLRMVVVLALVLAAIYGVYRLMKRLGRPKASDSSAIKLLASTSLGPGKALHVVCLGSKAYLVGAADAAVSLVAEIEDKEFIDALILDASTRPQGPLSPVGRDFGALLSSVLKRSGAGIGKKARKQDDSASGGFIAEQRERLRKF
jgi:flagellar protein FliO/FliZ